jgi:hypothetical protein
MSRCEPSESEDPQPSLWATNDVLSLIPWSLPINVRGKACSDLPRACGRASDRPRRRTGVVEGSYMRSTVSALGF